MLQRPYSFTVAVACVVIVCGCDKSKRSTDSEAATGVASATLLATAAPVGSPTASEVPSSNAGGRDVLARYLAYQRDLAPLLRHMTIVARDPKLNGDAVKMAAALKEDKGAQDFQRESRRLRRLHKLTVNEVAEAGALVADADKIRDAPSGASPSTIAFDAKHGEGTMSQFRAHGEELRALKVALDPKDGREIDCGRQPESCSCTPCDPYCEEDPKYRACLNDCLVAFGKCVLETLGAGSVLCAVTYATCSASCPAAGSCDSQ
jgi:hypothetical protein